MIIVVVWVAYGGEGFKSRLQVTRCQGGQKGWNQASAFSRISPSVFATATIRRQSDLHGLATYLLIILLVIVSAGSFVEEELMVVLYCQRVE